MSLSFLYVLSAAFLDMDLFFRKLLSYDNEECGSHFLSFAVLISAETGEFIAVYVSLFSKKMLKIVFKIFIQIWYGRFSYLSIIKLGNNIIQFNWFMYFTEPGNSN